MYDIMKKHKQAIFHHTFRLVHNNKEYLKKMTKYHNVLYANSKQIIADTNNLQQQLKKA